MLELLASHGCNGLKALGRIHDVEERHAALLPGVGDELPSLLQHAPALEAPLQCERLDRRHLQQGRHANDIVRLNLLLNVSHSPFLEAPRNAVLERTLQRHVCHLQLPGAVGRHEHQMDARMMRAQEHAELLALVHDHTSSTRMMCASACRRCLRMHVSAYGITISLTYCCMVVWLLQWFSLKVRWHSDAMEAGVLSGNERAVLPWKISCSGRSSPSSAEARPGEAW